MNHGFVYVLSNPAMPGIFKIGMTERSPFRRAEELSSMTSAPLPFYVEMYVAVRNMVAYERLVHERLSQFRIAGNREFFSAPAYLVADVVMHSDQTLSTFIYEPFQTRIDLELIAQAAELTAPRATKAVQD